MTMDPAKLHKLAQLAFQTRDKAYAPYSKFRVGASILLSTGEMVGGCNTENASYPAGVCAERNAVGGAISTYGAVKIVAVVVVSDLPTPSVSPCGICRQTLREFMLLDAPVYMLADTYPYKSDEVPKFIKPATGCAGSGQPTIDEPDLATTMTLEELLPMSFGPESLAANNAK